MVQIITPAAVYSYPTASTTIATTRTTIAATVAAIAVAVAATFVAATFATALNTSLAALTTTIAKTVATTFAFALLLPTNHRRVRDWCNNRENRAGQGAQKHQIEAQAPTILPRLEPGRCGWDQKYDREDGNKSEIRFQPRALRAGALFLTHHPFARVVYSRFFPNWTKP